MANGSFAFRRVAAWPRKLRVGGKSATSACEFQGALDWWQFALEQGVSAPLAPKLVFPRIGSPRCNFVFTDAARESATGFGGFTFVEFEGQAAECWVGHGSAVGRSHSKGPTGGRDVHASRGGLRGGRAHRLRCVTAPGGDTRRVLYGQRRDSEGADGGGQGGAAAEPGARVAWRQMAQGACNLLGCTSKVFAMLPAIASAGGRWTSCAKSCRWQGSACSVFCLQQTRMQC